MVNPFSNDTFTNEFMKRLSIGITKYSHAETSYEIVRAADNLRNALSALEEFISEDSLILLTEKGDELLKSAHEIVDQF